MLRHAYNRAVRYLVCARREHDWAAHDCRFDHSKNAIMETKACRRCEVVVTSYESVERLTRKLVA